QVGQRAPGLAVNVDVFGDLGDIDDPAEVRWQAVAQQHLTVVEVDVRERVWSSPCHVEDADHGEGVIDEVRLRVSRLHRQVDRVPDLLVELLVDGRAEHDLTGDAAQVVALRGRHAQISPAVLRRVGGDDLVRDAERDDGQASRL